MKKVHFPGPSKSKTFFSKKTASQALGPSRTDLPIERPKRLASSSSNPAIVNQESETIEEYVSGISEEQSDPNYSLFSDFESANMSSPPKKENPKIKKMERELSSLRRDLEMAFSEKNKLENELIKEKKRTKKMEKDSKQKDQRHFEEKEAWQEEKAKLFAELTHEKNEKISLRGKTSELELEINSQKSKYESELLKIVAQIRGLKSLQTQFHEEKQTAMNLQNALEGIRKEAELFRIHLKGVINFFVGVLDEIHTKNDFENPEKSKNSPFSNFWQVLKKNTASWRRFPKK